MKILVVTNDVSLGTAEESLLRETKLYEQIQAFMPDLLILDVELTTYSYAHGFPLYKLIQELYEPGELPIYCVSNSPRSERQDVIDEFGWFWMFGHDCKPVDPELLLLVITYVRRRLG